MVGVNSAHSLQAVPISTEYRQAISLLRENRRSEIGKYFRTVNSIVCPLIGTSEHRVETPLCLKLYVLLSELDLGFHLCAHKHIISYHSIYLTFLSPHNRHLVSQRDGCLPPLGSHTPVFGGSSTTITPSPQMA